ncbi:MAG TPA: tetratricopeptide repeat protein [Alphaproteobacteria bacterium]|nr:tetratricopeptide repeat protein [Alphaproteobacteria bacterium]
MRWVEHSCKAIMIIIFCVGFLVLSVQSQYIIYEYDYILKGGTPYSSTDIRFEDPNVLAEYLYNIGSNYSLHDQNDYAFGAFDEATKLNPNYKDAWMKKGDVLYNLGKYEEAADAYDRAAHLDSTFPEAWQEKGNALFMLGKINESNIAFSIAAREWIDKGNEAFRANLYEDALIYFNKSIEMDSHYKLYDDCSVNPNLAIACQKKGETLQKLGRITEAIEVYNNAANLWNQLGYFGKSIEICEEIFEFDQENEIAWSNSGLAYAASYQYENATQAIDNAIEANPEDSIIWIAKGDILFHFCNYSEANGAYDRALDLDPQNARAWNGKGATQFELGQEMVSKGQDRENITNKYKEALECFDKAIEIDESYGDAWHWRSIILRDIGDCYGDKNLIQMADEASKRAIILRNNDYLEPNVFHRAKRCH